MLKELKIRNDALLLFIALGFMPFVAHAGSWSGWIYQNPYPTKNALLALKFVTPQKGWIVGQYGTILFTTDGGENWQYQESGTEHDLKSVSFVNERVGWAVSNGGVIIHTLDGGKKWQKQSNFTVSFHEVFAISEKECWVGGTAGMLLHTADGGTAWNRQDIGASADIAGIFFRDTKRGWVLSAGKVYRTKDGGKSWEVSELPPIKYPEPRGLARAKDHGWQGSVFFMDEKKGWATVSTWYVFRTEDGGKTWLASEVSNTIDGISFADEKNGCMAGTSILCTEDGGKTWKERLGARPGEQDIKGGYLLSLWGISFASQSTGWAVGNDGQIWKTEDGGKRWHVKSRYSPFVYFWDSKTAWGKTAQNNIAKTEDGGKTWRVQKIFNHDVNIKFFFLNSTLGWAVGRENGRDHYRGPLILNYFILHTNNGGKKWVTQFKAPGKELRDSDDLVDIFFINPDTGWAVGSNGLILHTVDRGKRWKRQVSGAKHRLKRAGFINSENGFVIGDRGAWENTRAEGIILYTEDGGGHWREAWKKSSVQLNELFFLDRNTIWVTGEKSTGAVLLYSDDLGKTWTEKEVKDISLDSACFFNNDRGVLFTDEGFMLITTDGGKTWTKKRRFIRKQPWHCSDIFKEKNSRELYF